MRSRRRRSPRTAFRSWRSWGCWLWPAARRTQPAHSCFWWISENSYRYLHDNKKVCPILCGIRLRYYLHPYAGIIRIRFWGFRAMPSLSLSALPALHIIFLRRLYFKLYSKLNRFGDDMTVRESKNLVRINSISCRRSTLFCPPIDCAAIYRAVVVLILEKHDWCGNVDV